MRAIFCVIFISLAGAGRADPGHLADVAGHDHWIAGAAIGIAIVLGVWNAAKGKKADAGQQAAKDKAEA
jgi:hypothetical protein